MVSRLETIGVAGRDIEVARDEGVYKLSCVRGPSGIVVMLAEDLKRV